MNSSGRIFLLGIDVGTSGSKAVLIDENGELVASSTHEYPLSHPQPLWAEQDPEDWWQATVKSIRSVVEAAEGKGTIAGMGLTGQMHGLVLLDREGGVLRPAILWNDQRTGAQCEEITERIGFDRLLELTGNPALPGFTAPKILWVRKHEREIFDATAKFLLPKDYVRFRLTGEFFGEVSDASGTGLFDAGKRRWSEPVIDALEIPRAWLADITESPVASARVSGAAAKATGLPEGLPIAGGGGDQAAQAVGTGIVGEGVVSVTVGTSGVVFAATDKYRIEPEGKLHAFCHAVPGQWHLMGVMLSAAGSFRWYRDAFGDLEKEIAKEKNLDPYDLLVDAAKEVPAGCEGLLFLPYLTGERTPHPDPHARGVFFGLTLRHGKPHLTRAVLEGVTYGLRDSLELMRATGLAIRELRASGGGAKSAFWRQLLADVFCETIVTVNAGEGAAFGAALLGGVASGVYPDVPAACAATLRQTGSVSPGPDAGVYEKNYPRYRSLYPALKDEFQKLAHA